MMRVFVILAFLSLCTITFCYAEDRDATNININNFQKVELSSWNSTFSNLSIQKSETQKRDVNPDAPFSFEVYYDSNNNVKSDKVTFSGEPVNLGFNKKSGGKVSVAATRYYSFGSVDPTKASTTLVFEVDFNGRDVSKSTGPVQFKVFNLDYKNKGTIDVGLFAWTYDNTGIPSIFNQVTTTSENFNGNYQFTLTDVGAHGFTRFVIVFGLLDSSVDCPRSIDNHSLLGSACIAPAKNNKPRETTVTAAQLFQDAGKLKASNLKYSVSNCDGYDQKICQHPSDDIVANFVDFDEATQVFSFGKPCQGVPSGFACVTTVQVEILPFKDGSRTCNKHVRAKVLLPVNDRGIKNIYGGASCAVLPKVGDHTPFYTKINDNKNKDCAHYVGCYDYLQFTGIMYISELDIGGGSGNPEFKIENPFTVSQCKSICLDNGATHAAIYANGYQCTCLNGPNYRKPKSDSVCMDADAAMCLSSKALPGETCGTDAYALVFNLDRCKSKVAAGHNFDAEGTPVTAPPPDKCEGLSHDLETDESCTEDCECEARLCTGGKCDPRCKTFAGNTQPPGSECWCEDECYGNGGICNNGFC